MDSLFASGATGSPSSRYSSDVVINIDVVASLGVGRTSSSSRRRRHRLFSGAVKEKEKKKWIKGEKSTYKTWGKAWELLREIHHGSLPNVSFDGIFTQSHHGRLDSTLQLFWLCHRLHAVAALDADRTRRAEMTALHSFSVYSSVSTSPSKSENSTATTATKAATLSGVLVGPLIFTKNVACAAENAQSRNLGNRREGSRRRRHAWY